LEVQLYTPHKNQKIIHDSINNEPYKYYCLNIGRQFGKSLLGENQALFWALNYANVKIGWASPTYKQCKKIYNEIEGAFYDTDLFKTNKQDLFLESKITKSTIQFFSTEIYNNIRGFTFDYLICDEFAFMQEQAWTEVLKATVLVKGRKVLFISTPRGKNHFYNLFQLGLGQSNNYKSFKMTSYDNPMIDPSEIDEARNSLPSHVFQQEYMAEFLDDGTSVFPKPIINNTPNKTDKYFAGVDVGRADDYTVVTILNRDGQIVEINRWRHLDWSMIVNYVCGVINKYNAHTFVEVNGVGDPVFEMIKNKIKNGNAFVTTSKTKNKAIEELMVDMQEEEINILNTDWLIQELEVFTYDYNFKSKAIKYSAPYGFHDDGVMSLAIANQARRNLFRAGKYIIG